MKHDTDKLFVYLCDDGADPLKQQWVADMNQEHPNLIYVTRPKEFKGHGKAGNLNYCLREIIYKNVLSHNENLKTEDGKTKRKKFIPRKELVVIFDADMVARSNFLTRLLPYFSKNRRCVLVQSPQTFHNVPMDADFFDAHNVNFFQYMLPCFSSWNTTTCCGTNFIVAARALQTVNFFPTISVTEDMYLAMLLCAAGEPCCW
jgi:cellulose synthase (UDP-forming)